MCTISIVAHRRGVRMVCNRDERRTRAAAWAPRERRVGRQSALFPVDPQSGGTWVGVNRLGLIAALLNRSVDGGGRPASRLTSRGLIVPRLLASSSIDEAVQAVQSLPRDRFAPFRVVLTQGGLYAAVTGGGGELAAITELGVLGRPRVFSSSSLGDELVETFRHRLFHDLLAASRGRPLAAQAALHRHQWADRPEISVLMERREARTVSRSQVDVDYPSGRVWLLYEPVADAATWATAC